MFGSANNRRIPGAIHVQVGGGKCPLYYFWIRILERAPNATGVALRHERFEQQLNQRTDVAAN